MRWQQAFIFAVILSGFVLCRNAIAQQQPPEFLNVGNSTDKAISVYMHCMAEELAIATGKNRLRLTPESRARSSCVDSSHSTLRYVKRMAHTRS